jgi:hypothetical protein
MSGYIALGKYSNEFEDALHYMCLSDWASHSDGNVEGPDGFFWLISNSWEEVQPENGEFNSLMEEWFKQNPSFEDSEEFREGLVGHFIIREDNNGLVWLESFESRLEAYASFKSLQFTYSEWDTQDDED